MTKSLRQLIVWSTILVASILLGKLLDVGRDALLIILPTSITTLDGNWIRAIAITCSAALVAWLAGAIVGHYLGLFAAAAKLSTSTEGVIKRYLGASVNQLYEFAFIIPFVISVSALYAIGVRMHIAYGFPRWLVAILLIMAAGAILGGHQVFKSVYSSTAKATPEAIALSRSLLNAPSVHQSFFRRTIANFRTARRLRDFRIRDYTESLAQAFHLSLVAVIIIETVTPMFYEHFAHQSGAVKEYLGGVGRMILQAQESLRAEQIAGVLWLILIIDMIITHVIELASSLRWLSHSRRSEP